MGVLSSLKAWVRRVSYADQTRLVAPFAGGIGGALVLVAIAGSSAPDRWTPTARLSESPLLRPAVVLTTSRNLPLDVVRDHYALIEAKRVAPRRVAAFFPLYEEASRTFGVNWRLLASVHRQETAFSASETTYHGLNFAGCCAGPMQFNVTNGPKSTWERYRHAYKHGTRPDSYPRPAKKHPSIYDNFDSIMAAGKLLRDNGSRSGLGEAAWRAAYDYYGHDLFGVTYANHVTARAQGWRRDGFCVNCLVDEDIVAQLERRYGKRERARLLGMTKRELERQRKLEKREARRRKKRRELRERRERRERAERRRRAAERREARDRRDQPTTVRTPSPEPKPERTPRPKRPSRPKPSATPTPTDTPTPTPTMATPTPTPDLLETLLGGGKL